MVALPCDLGVEHIGGKAKGLSDLMRLGIDVPAAFAIPAGALVHDDDLARAIADIGPGPFAVRSSGVAEDGAVASFAGVHDTFLDVDDAGVRDAVERCRASGDSERARAYRAGRASDAALGVAVVVQRMVRADVAGVVFSADPVARRRDLSIVEAVRGLGERLVSGEANPDRAVVDRSGAVLALQRAESEGVLDQALAVAVARMAVALEEKLGFAVDVEWAVEGGKLWLLQVRPITTRIDAVDALTPAPPSSRIVTSPSAPRRTVWTNTNAAELLPDVAKPLVFDLIQSVLRSLMFPLTTPFGVDPADVDLTGLVGGRAYFNVSTVLGLLRAFPFARRISLRSLAEGAAKLGGDATALHDAIASLDDGDIPVHRVSFARMVLGVANLAAVVLRHQSGDGTATVARLRARNDRLTRVDVQNLDDESLIAHLTDTVAVLFATDTGYLGAAGVGVVSQSLLPRLTHRYLGDEHGALAGQLLRGIGGLDSAEAGRALARVAAVFRERGEDSDEFRAALSAFLELHGHHARGEVDVSVKRWREEPEYVIRLVRALAAAPAHAGTSADGTARAALLDDVGRRLQGPFGFFRRALLFAVAKRAARGAACRENGKSEAVRNVALMRVAVLEIGARLVKRGFLDDRDDVFFLFSSEMPGALAGESMRARVIERKEHFAANRKTRLPTVVVTDAGGALEGERPRAASSSAASSASSSATMTGVAASPGVVEGIARVVLHADGESVVLPGEILVAPFTDPGWAPYFLVAAGVVMDFGGMLSHGSVVAREYGLPAVVNVGPATERIRTGQRLRVDGDRGLVHILD